MAADSINSKSPEYAAFLALLGLMHEKALISITVGEVLERACISRGTFYAHFCSIAALRERLIGTVFKELDSVMAAASPSEIIKSPNSFFLDLALMIRSGRLPSRLLGEFIAVPELCEELKPWLTKYLLDDPAFVESCDGGIQAELYARFLSGGVIHTISMWIEQGFSTAPHDIALFLTRQVMLRRS